jgi:hypothetical protein
MPFQLSLYRAAEGLGPLITWDREHRLPLGTRGELRAALDRLLPGLRWSESGHLLFASGPFGAEDHALELTLHGGPDEVLLDFHVYAFPPPIRAIMSGLGLNYCYALEACELYDPFSAGEHWPADSGHRSPAR